MRVIALQQRAGNAALARWLVAEKAHRDTAPAGVVSATTRAGVRRARHADAKLQRLIAIGDPTPGVGRFVVVNNLRLRFPGEQIFQLETAPLGLMRTGEVLYISAHGSPASVGGRDPRQLAQLLINQGLKNGTLIDLKACSTAVVGNSYVEALGNELWSLSAGTIFAHIIGYTGTHVIRSDGSSATKDPVKNNATMQLEYSKILAGHKREVDTATDYIKDAKLKATPLHEVAEKVTAMTRTVFDELYEHNEKVAKEESQASGTSSVARLTGQLDHFLEQNLWASDPVWGDPLIHHLIRERERARWSGTPSSYHG